MEAAGLQPGSDTLDRIIEADSAVVVLRAEKPELLVEQFRQVTRRSGQTVYVWHPEEGMRSLRDMDVRVPGCRTVGDTLRFVLHSMHFGVYVLTGIRGQLAKPELALMRKLLRGVSDHVRKVVLLTDDDALVTSVEDIASVIGGSVPGSRPRLRDGRWVV
jgi:hypothetical protein